MILPRRKIVEYLGDTSFWSGFRDVRLSCGHLTVVKCRVYPKDGSVKYVKPMTTGCPKCLEATRA